MRHTFLVLAASTFLAVFAGCACNNNCHNQANSGPGDAGGVRCRQAPCEQAGAGGQGGQAGPGGAVSYPYYTTRGPRDFLETHPQSIGP